jgi:hypothetical protein
VLIIPSSWGSQRAITYKPSSNFSGAIVGEKEDFCKGSFSRTIFYFVFVLFCFILFLLASFYQKYKRKSSFIVTFTCLLLVWDFYFLAPGLLVVLSFPQPLNFSSVFPRSSLKPLADARMGGLPSGQSP